MHRECTPRRDEIGGDAIGGVAIGGGDAIGGDAIGSDAIGSDGKGGAVVYYVCWWHGVGRLQMLAAASIVRREAHVSQNIDGVGEAIVTHTASPAELPFSDQPLQPTSSESLHDCVRRNGYNWLASFTVF